jgi:hypothetical protein
MADISSEGSDSNDPAPRRERRHAMSSITAAPSRKVTFEEVLEALRAWNGEEVRVLVSDRSGGCSATIYGRLDCSLEGVDGEVHEFGLEDRDVNGAFRFSRTRSYLCWIEGSTVSIEEIGGSAEWEVSLFG